MVLPEVPGIIEAAMAITRGPDGRVSFRVVVGGDSGRSAECDLVELIISAEDVERALAEIKVAARPGTEKADERPALPCHIGFYSNAVHAAA